MKNAELSPTKEAQLFAGRFGFLTQDIFFNHFCPKGRTQKYFYWKTLIDAGWFLRSSRDSRVLYLSRKSRSELGHGCVPARELTYVDHDSQVAEFYLRLQRTGLVLRSWTEADLTRAPWNSYEILGTDRIPKIPDLILDIKTEKGFLRTAIEIEKTRKSRNRYAQISLAYLDMPRIDLIIFGCESNVIASEIKKSFEGDIFIKAQKVPGYFLLNDFTKNEFESKFHFNKREFKFRDFIQTVTKLPWPLVPIKPDCDRTPVRPSNFDFEEAS